MDFLDLAAVCGPLVHPLTTQAIARVESGFNPWAIRNNTLARTFLPSSRADAAALVNRFHGQGHQLAIGLMQVTTPWIYRFHITAESLLDECTNIGIGSRILADNYRRLAPGSASPAEALSRALSAYWSGKPDTGGVYVNHVYKLAGSTVRVPVTKGVTDGVLGARSAASPVLFAAARTGRNLKGASVKASPNNRTSSPRQSPLFFNTGEFPPVVSP